MAKIANNPRTRRAGNPAWRRGGPSPNPKGRPRDGQSWAGVIRELTDLPAEKVAAEVGGKRTELGRALLAMPHGTPLKRLLLARVVTALYFEPSASLLRALFEAEDMADLEARITALEGGPLRMGRQVNYPAGSTDQEEQP
jgi:hypothetical protein